MGEDKTKEELLICACEDVEHSIVIRYDEDDGSPMGMVYMDIHLSVLPLRKRLVHGLRYIFGRRCRYGDFDEFVFRPKDWKKLADAADYLKRLEEIENEDGKRD